MKKILGLLTGLISLFASTCYADVVNGILGGHNSSPSDLLTNNALIILFLLTIISIITIVVMKRIKKQ